ncbi:ABC transporter permease [Candidatus Fermentibacteria bacterium]|nr:ABC transporter permease [Candidatus Fermentibacteria bacterium]
MITRNTLSLAIRSFTRRKASSVAPLLSVAMATGTTFIVLSVATGVHKAGVSGMLSTLPITRLVATARQVDILFLRLGTSSSLSEETVRSISRLKGVVSVWPEQVLTMPASLIGDLLGTTFSTDCAVYGVSHEFFPLRERPSEFVPRPAGEPVPAVLSSQLIDLYNSGFAGSQHLPGLSPKALIGRHFTLLLGTSSFLPAERYDRTTSVRCEIVGLSDVVSLTGVTVPDSYALDWHRLYHGPSSPPAFASVHLEVASSDIVAQVRRDIESLGLHVQSPRELAEKIALVSRYISVAAGAIIALFLALAGIGTATTLGLEVALQAERIGVYRSLGASRHDILRLYVLRAFLLGLAGASAGLAAGLFLVAAARQALSTLQLGLPASWLTLNPWHALLALVLGVIASVGAGLVPALRASRLDPADALRSTSA